MAKNPLGRFCWYELMSTDPAGSKSFYTSLHGWTAQAFEGSEMPYDLFMLGETPISGLMALPEEARADGAQTHWLAYVSTPDVDATVDKATGLGGAVDMPPMDIPTVGRLATLRDPQGGMFAVYRPETPIPDEDGEDPVGTVSWHELATVDYEKAFDFYQALFDWEIMEDMDMGPAGIYRIYGRNGKQLGGIFNKPPEMPVVAWMLYTRVADLDAAVETVKSLGGTVLNGPMDVPGGDRIAQCVDAQGGGFALHVKGSGG